MPPLKIAGLLQAKWANDVLKSAVELDVFTTLKANPMTADDIAKKLNVDAKATKLLMDALVSMEFLAKKSNRYELNELSDTYLVKTSDLYMGSHIIGRPEMQNAWSNLSETVRTGKAYQTINEPKAAEAFFPALAKAIFPLNYTTAQSLAAKLNVQTMSGQINVLDLAAGTGVWSLPMAQSNKNVHVDALDFPAVIQVTKEYATKYGVTSNYGYLAGNWREISLQPNHYDIIILGHILHSEGVELSAQLLKYCAAALKPGGKLVVAEFLSNEEHTGPVFARLFAVNMLLSTEDGCVFSTAELSEMICDAGLKNPERLELPFWGAESPIVVATK